MVRKTRQTLMRVGECLRDKVLPRPPHPHEIDLGLRDASGKFAQHFVRLLPCDLLRQTLNLGHIEVSTGFGGALVAGQPVTLIEAADATDTLYFDADGSDTNAPAVVVTQFTNNIFLKPSDLSIS